MTSKAELKTILLKHSGNERFAKILARIAFAPKAGTAEAEAWAERLEVLYATGTVAEEQEGGLSQGPPLRRAVHLMTG